MNNIICAFSSDYRSMYKADIYRAVALPTDDIIHFRYQTKYVDDEIIRIISSNPSELINRPVAIFHTKGNFNNSHLNNICIRSATISAIEISNETGILHIYLKLGSSSKYMICSSNPEDLLPGVKFLSLLKCYPLPDSKWSDVVEKVTHLGPTVFFHIKGIYHKGKRVELLTRDTKKSTYIKLTQGKDYYLKISIANIRDAGRIKIVSSESTFVLNSLNPIESTVPLDDVEIPISVRRLPDSKQMALLQFQPFESQGEDDPLSEYSVNLETNIEMGLSTPFQFGLLTILTLGSGLLLAPRGTNTQFSEWYINIILILVFTISSGILFYKFNKK